MAASGAGATVQSLPPEVLERCIDFLHEDRATLCSCSLVCRAWLAAPRHHLFGRLDLRCNHVEELCRLLSSSVTTIPHVGESLRIHEGAGSDRKHVAHLARHLRQVTSTLHLHRFFGGDWGAASDSLVRNEDGLTGYHTLVLTTTRFLGFDDLAGLLCRSQYLRHICFDDVICGFQDAEAAAGDKPPLWHTPRLKSVRLRGCELRPLLEFLLNRGCLAELEQLEVPQITPSDHDCVMQLLPKIAGTLKHLTIGFHNFGGDVPTMDLSANHALVSVKLGDLNMSAYELPHMAPAIPTHVVSSLKTLASSVLKEIVFEITIQFFGYFDVIEWLELDEHLLRFDSLQKVEFSFEGRTLIPLDVVRTVKARMSNCNRRNILRVEFTRRHRFYSGE